MNQNYIDFPTIAGTAEQLYRDLSIYEGDKAEKDMVELDRLIRLSDARDQAVAEFVYKYAADNGFGFEFLIHLVPKK